MKNIFKKNSIIITALAIMIVIAGYLSFTNRDTDKDGSLVDNSALQSDIYTEGDGLEVVTDTTVTGTPDNTADVTVTGTPDTTDTDTTDTDADDTNDAQELGNNDISDEDALADSQDVADNGELNLEDGTPGEAVLASATQDASYFISSKLQREQRRAQSRETLMDIIQSTDATDEAKNEATDSLIELTQIGERENAAEILLGAKGFDGAIVFILDGTADVVVNAESLTDQQLAIIEDVVKSETQIAVNNIEIIPVIISE